MNENESPEKIVQRVLQGDIDSYRLIVEKFEKQIFSIGMRFFKNEDDSYDFTQEVFIKAYNNLMSYKGTAPFKYWLTKIAYNHGINKKKSGSKTDGDVDTTELLQAEEFPEVEHERNELKELLIQEINKLPDKYRLCIDLYFFMGLSYKQIEHITGIKENTIKSHVLRAKKILRNNLKGTIAEDYYEM